MSSPDQRSGDDDQSELPQQPTLRFVQYGGGPDESFVSGNLAGYGELANRLQDAVDRFTPGDETLDLDIKDIVDEESEIQFDWFEVRDPITTSRVDKQDVTGRLMGIGCIALLVLILGFAASGFINFVHTVFGD